MAENLGAKVGDAVLVTSPQGELTPSHGPQIQPLRVAGIFNSGFFDYDSSGPSPASLTRNASSAWAT